MQTTCSALFTTFNMMISSSGKPLSDAEIRAKVKKLLDMMHNPKGNITAVSGMNLTGIVDDYAQVADGKPFDAVVWTCDMCGGAYADALISVVTVPLAPNIERNYRYCNDKVPCITEAMQRLSDATGIPMPSDYD